MKPIRFTAYAMRKLDLVREWGFDFNQASMTSLVKEEEVELP